MIGDELRAGRENDLILSLACTATLAKQSIVLATGVRLRMRTGAFQIRFARAQRVADGPAHALAHFQFAHPDGLAAVGVRLDAVLHRQERGGAVMVRNVPLDAAGNPRADQADERRLDDVLAIDEVVAVALVHRLEQPPADLRQHADAHVFVLQVNDAIGLVRLDAREGVVKRVGINAPLRALRVAAEIKHGFGSGSPAK